MDNKITADKISNLVKQFIENLKEFESDIKSLKKIKKKKQIQILMT